jgi:hypothetical protein
MIIQNSFLMAVVLAFQQTASPPACVPLPSDMVSTALRLRAEQNDQNAFIRAFDNAFGVSGATFFRQPMLYVAQYDEITIGVVFPFAKFREDLIDAARRREPIDGVKARDAVAVVVIPKTINAPDIERIIVERDNREIPARESKLAPATLQTALGATVVRHAGEVLFPCEAFMPGAATLRVTAIGTTGNILNEFTDRDLTVYMPTLQKR